MSTDAHAREITACLFRSHEAHIHRYVYTRVQRLDLADDLTQNVFLKVLNHFAAGHGRPRRVKPWLYSIASNVCKDHWRAASRYVAALDWHADGAPSTAAPVGEVITALKETLCFIDRVLITRVNREQRSALTLVYCKGTTVKEAADVLRVPRNTIKSRCKRGIETVVAEAIAGGRPLSEDEARSVLAVMPGAMPPLQNGAAG